MSRSATEGARRANLIASGLCQQCRQPHSDGTARCLECLAAKSLKATAVYWQRVEAGRCTTCGKVPVDGARDCPSCAEHRRVLRWDQGHAAPRRCCSRRPRVQLTGRCRAHRVHLLLHLQPLRPRVGAPADGAARPAARLPEVQEPQLERSPSRDAAGLKTAGNSPRGRFAGCDG